MPNTQTLVAATRLRLLSIPSWVLVTELFIGSGWLRAWAEKMLSPAWWRGETLAAFLDTTADARVPWFHLVTDVVVGPNLVLISALVAFVQLALGVALVTGRGRVPALLTGIALNVCFVLAGAVTPSAFYILAQLAVLLWVIEQRRTDRHHLLATGISLAGLAVAGSAILSIGTLHPEHVIEDPSMMLVFAGGLAALGAERARLGARLAVAEPREPELVEVA